VQLYIYILSPYVPLWHGKGQLYLYLYQILLGLPLPLPDIIRVIKTKEHDMGGYFRGTADLTGQHKLPSQQ